MSNKSRILSFCFALVLAESVFASGLRILDSVSIKQDEASRRVTVTYSLAGEPGIVTFSVQTNDAVAGWVDVGGEAVSCVYGDVNRVVSNTESESSLVWIPDDTWPDKHIQNGSLRAVVTVWPIDNPPDYAVVEPRMQNCVFYYANAQSLPGGATNEIYRKGKYLLRRIHATGARFTMGSGVNEPNREPFSGTKETPHLVTFTNDFYIGVFEVTQDQYRLSDATWNAYFYFTNLPYSAELPITGVDYAELRGSSESDGGKWSPDNPLSVAHKVSATSFFGRLRAMTNIDFDLPTEAEWEFACRAGTTSPTYAGGIHNAENLDKIAWYSGNARSTDCAVAFPTSASVLEAGTLPRPGGLKKPNDWGLYDMIGNVQEWCLDNAWKDLGSESAVAPMGSATSSASSSRITRGGSYCDGIEYNRAAYRYYATAAAHKVWNGFRVACPCPLTKKW